MARMSGPGAAGGGAGGPHPVDDGDEWGDLEIEVTDLRTGATVERTLPGGPAGGRPPLTAPMDFADSDLDDLEDLDDEAEAEAERAPVPAPLRVVWMRQRGTRAALVAGAVVLVMVALLLSNPGVSGAIRTDLFPPTPTLAPGTNTLWVRHVVPWGTLTIDGHAIAEPNEFAPFVLGRGQHSLTYEAPPFHTLRCTVSVPASRSDTCPLAITDPNQLNPPPLDERALDLGAVPSQLPAGDFTALIAAMQRQLDGSTSTTQLAPGDHYAMPDGQVAVAQRPMSVTLAFVVAPANPSGASANYNGMDCNPLCVVPGVAASYMTAWPVTAEVSPQWRYTDSGGAPQVITSAAPGVGPAGGYGGNLLTFSAQWTTHGWQVTLPALNTFATLDQIAQVQCQSAMQALPPMSGSNSSNGYSIMFGQSTVQVPLADGCAFAVVPQNGNGSSSGPSGLLLLRGGALMTANDAAHAMFPTLPVADADEAALAQQLGRGQGQP